jgi:hypothetical protein
MGQSNCEESNLVSLFKAPPHVNSPHNGTPSGNPTTSFQSRTHLNKLSEFSKVALNHTDIRYRCMASILISFKVHIYTDKIIAQADSFTRMKTSSQQHTKSSSTSNMLTSQKLPASKSVPSLARKNDATFAQNQRLPPSISQPRSQPQVVIHQSASKKDNVTKSTTEIPAAKYSAKNTSSTSKPEAANLQSRKDKTNVSSSAVSSTPSQKLSPSSSSSISLPPPKLKVQTPPIRSISHAETRPPQPPINRTSSLPQEIRPAVVISSNLAQEQRAEYTFRPEEDARILAAAVSTKRSYDAVDGSTDLRGQSNDAVDKLMDLLDDLTLDVSDRGEATSQMLKEIDRAIQNVNSFRKLEVVPIAQLIKLQRICEDTMRQIADETCHIGLINGPFAEVMPTVSEAHRGLRAGRVSLNVMIGVPKEKQLSSEALLSVFMKLLKFALDAIVIPIVEPPQASIHGSTETKLEIASFAGPLKKNILDLLHEIGRILRLMSDVLLSVAITDQARALVVDLATRLLFVRNSSSEKDSIIGIQSFESLRREIPEILAALAQDSHEAMSICNSILASWGDLPISRHVARQFKLQDGTSIQLITATVMRIIQAQTERGASVSERQISEVDSESESESDFDEQSEPESPVKRNQPSNSNKRSGISLESFEYARHLAAMIANHLVRRVKPSKEGEDAKEAFAKESTSHFSKLIEILLEDLLAVLGSLEWPAAELLLDRLEYAFLGFANSDSEGVSTKNTALELLGLLGAGIYGVKRQARKSIKKLSPTQSSLDRTLVQLGENILEDGPYAVENELLQLEGPYHVIIAWLLNENEQPQILSALSFHLNQWVYFAHNGVKERSERERKEKGTVTAMPDLLSKLRPCLARPWLLQAK